MARLEQPPLLDNSKAIWVDVKALSKKKFYMHLSLKYMVEGRPVLKLRSTMSLYEMDRVLEWLEQAVKTKRLLMGEAFSAMMACQQVIVIEQRRIRKADYAMILAEGGGAEYPHPFFYSVDFLVNPDPDGNVNTGIGMRFDGLGYAALHRFFVQLRDEIWAAAKEA